MAVIERGRAGEHGSDLYWIKDGLEPGRKYQVHSDLSQIGGATGSQCRVFQTLKIIIIIIIITTSPSSSSSSSSSSSIQLWLSNSSTMNHSFVATALRLHSE